MIETTMVSYFTDNNRTWNNNKLVTIFPKIVVDKIISIHILIHIQERII